MPQKMVSLKSFSQSTARILTPNGKVLGTGFLVTRNLVVTCAHVLGNSREDILVRFSGKSRSLSAQVVPEYYRDPEHGDLAFLDVDGVHEDLLPLLLGSTEQDLMGVQYSAFGFSNRDQSEGSYLQGKVLGFDSRNGQRLLRLESLEVPPGFSGAPVWDEQRSVAFGMIFGVRFNDQSGSSQNALAIPAEALWQACPEIQPAEESESPYLGLGAFGAENAKFFFGREALIKTALSDLRGGCRFLAVVGPSGSGKSSLVRAGLLPALQTGSLPESDTWHQIEIRPGSDPYPGMLAFGFDLANVDGYLRRNSPAAQRLILFIDEFDELFTLCPPEVRERFIRDLANALENPRLLVIITMRSDTFSTFTARAWPLAHSKYLKILNIPSTLQPDELRAMIEQPARAVGLTFEEGLMERIIADLSTGGEVHSSVLPMLQFTLSMLWERRKNSLLTNQAFEEIGGVTGSLSRWADAAYSDLPNSDQTQARSLLTALVGLGDQVDFSQPRALAELDQSDSALRLIKYFVDRRLLVTYDDKVALVNDTLIQEWPRLREWLLDDRQELRLHAEINKAAREWDAAKRDPDLLIHRGSRLKQVDDLIKRKNSPLNILEQEYILACQKKPKPPGKETTQKPFKRNFTKFLPSQNGFHFQNSFPARAYTLDTKFGKIDLEQASTGLAGGLVFAAADYFLAGRPIPASKISTASTVLHDYLFKRQIDSFNLPGGFEKYLEYMNPKYPDAQSSQLLRLSAKGRAWVMIKEEWPKIQKKIDTGQPCPLGLVQVKSTNLRQMARNRPVLVYGYELKNDRLTLHLYEPNYPDFDQITLSLDIAQPGQPVEVTFSTGEPVYCFFTLEYQAAPPPQLGAAPAQEQAQNIPDQSQTEAAEDVQYESAASWESSTGPERADFLPAVRDFVGRQSEIARLREQMDAASFAVITGMPGIGKTALAYELIFSHIPSKYVLMHTFESGEGLENLPFVSRVENLHHELSAYLLGFNQVTVETQALGSTSSAPIARTEMSFDRDSHMLAPLLAGSETLDIKAARAHQDAVAQALASRVELLNSLSQPRKPGVQPDPAIEFPYSFTIQTSAPTPDQRGTRLLAVTRFALDGDCEVLLPMRRAADGALVIDQPALEVHQRNVQQGIDYLAGFLPYYAAGLEQQKIDHLFQDSVSIQIGTRLMDSASGGPAADGSTARTVIKLDGDSELLVPFRRVGRDTPAVDLEFLDAHLNIVSQAVDYRCRVLACFSPAAELAESFARQLSDQTIEMRGLRVGGAPDEAPVLMARTEIKLDGDSQNILPMQQSEGGVIVDQQLMEVHQRNIRQVIDYKTRIMQVFLGNTHVEIGKAFSPDLEIEPLVRALSATDAVFCLDAYQNVETDAWVNRFIEQMRGKAKLLITTSHRPAFLPRESDRHLGGLSEADVSSLLQTPNQPGVEAEYGKLRQLTDGNPGMLLHTLDYLGKIVRPMLADELVSFEPMRAFLENEINRDLSAEARELLSQVAVVSDGQFYGNGSGWVDTFDFLSVYPQPVKDELFDRYLLNISTSPSGDERALFINPLVAAYFASLLDETQQRDLRRRFETVFRLSEAGQGALLWAEGLRQAVDAPTVYTEYLLVGLFQTNPDLAQALRPTFDETFDLASNLAALANDMTSTRVGLGDVQPAEPGALRSLPLSSNLQIILDQAAALVPPGVNIEPWQLLVGCLSVPDSVAYRWLSSNLRVDPADLRELIVRTASLDLSLTELIRICQRPGPFYMQDQDLSEEAQSCLAFSPDGRSLASGGGNGNLYFWNLNSGKLEKVIDGNPQESMTCLSFSPDGKTILAGYSHGHFKLWDRDTNKLIVTSEGTLGRPLGDTTSLVFAPDGTSFISSSGEQTIRLWDGKTGKHIRVFSGNTFFTEVAISPLGRLLISGALDGSISLWDLGSGELIGETAGHSDGITALAISPDGQTLLSGSRDRTLKLWDASSGKELVTLVGHQDVVAGAVFSPDGSAAVSASRDGSVKVWDLRSGRLVQNLPVGYPIHDMVLSPDGQVLAFLAFPGVITLWNLAQLPLVDAPAAEAPAAAVPFWSLYFKLEAAPGPLAVGQKLGVNLKIAPVASDGSQPMQIPVNTLELVVFIDAPGFQVSGGHKQTLLLVNGRPNPESLALSFMALSSGEQTIRLEVYPGAQVEGIQPLQLSQPVQVSAPEELPDIRELIDRRAIPSPQPDVMLYAALEETKTGEQQLRLHLTCPALNLDRERLPAIALNAADLEGLRQTAAQTAMQLSGSAPQDVLTGLSSMGRLLFDQLAPLGHPLRELYLKIYQRAMLSQRRWSWLIISDPEAVLPWEWLCPYGWSESRKTFIYRDFLAQTFIVAHWIGRQKFTLASQAPLGRLALAHYHQHPGAIAAWQNALGEAHVDIEQQRLGPLALMQPGAPYYGFHLVRYLDQRQAGRITDAADEPEPGVAGQDGSALLYRQRLKFAKRRPVVGLSFVKHTFNEKRPTDLEARWVIPFLHADSTAVIGARWPVSPAADQLFFHEFYAAMRSGVALGEAAWLARQAVLSAFPDRADWLAFAYFGHPVCEPYLVQPAQGFTLFEALDHQDDEPFIIGRSYRFRASYRADPPAWYEGQLHISRSLPISDQLNVKTQILATGLKSLKFDLASVEGSDEYQSVVALVMPAEPDQYSLVVRFQDGAKEIYTLMIDLDVVES